MVKHNIPNGNPSFPSTRMRRNRLSNWSRRLIQENKLSTDDLIWPIFVTDKNKRSSIDSMPGIFRIPLNEIVADIGEAQDYNIPATRNDFPQTTCKKLRNLSWMLVDDNIIHNLSNAVSDLILDIYFV